MAEYLELSGIRKEFGEFVALKGVALGVRQGELLCFLGPSGCGKTTLLRIIAGLEVQSAGTIVQAGATSRACRRWSATTASCSSRTRSFPTSTSRTTSPTGS
jgi:ABC-type Fe3+/spermidine/putrescine transport system ATPase subunit